MEGDSDVIPGASKAKSHDDKAAADCGVAATPFSFGSGLRSPRAQIAPPGFRIPSRGASSFQGEEHAS